MTTVPTAATESTKSVTASAKTTTYKTPNRAKRWFTEIGWRHLVAALFAAFAAFPFFFVLSASLNMTDTLSEQTLIPRKITFRHYKWLFTNGGEAPYGNWLFNTVVIGLITAVMTVFLAALASYPISRMRFKGRKVGLMALLLSNMFPNGLMAVAIYLLVRDVGEIWEPLGLGWKPAVILVYLGGALGGNVWLMKSFFDSLPVELDESAKVDGASHTRIFFTIILPLAKPILASIFFFSFIFAFNEFTIASVLLTGEQKNFTLSYGMQQFVSGRKNNWGPFAAGAIIAGVPIMIVFQFVQKFLVSGLTSGAVKG
jgi:arabinogalactan oligomer / maltooligosaccharide transport system permease protein